MQTLGRLWIKYGVLLAAALLIVGLLVGFMASYYLGVGSKAHPTLLIDAAETLEVPFSSIVTRVLSPQYPGLDYRYIFEGSNA